MREALDAAIDRKVLNQVVFAGKYVPNNQPILPGSTYYDTDHPGAADATSRRRSGSLGRRASSIPPSPCIAANSPIDLQVAQVIQSMVGEAGFEMKIQAIEANTLTVAGAKGDYQAMLVFWSGRPDPDGNISDLAAVRRLRSIGATTATPLDEALAKARQTTDARRAAQALQGGREPLPRRPTPISSSINIKWIWGTTARLDGFSPGADGLIRPQGMTLKP